MTTLTALPRRTRRTDFIRRQFSIAIFVERLERGGGIGDFFFVNDAVVICIERSHDRRHSSLPALSTLTARSTLTRTTGTARAAALLRGVIATRALRRLVLRECE